MKKISNYYFFVVCLVLTLTSCANKKDICTKCVAEEGKDIDITLSILPNTNQKTKAKSWHIPKDKIRSAYSFVDVWENEPLFTVCRTYLKGETGSENPNKILAVVLYLDLQLNNGVTIVNENIKGFSFYSASDKHYRHQAFKKIDGTFEEVKKLDFFTKDLTSNDMHGVLDKNIIIGEQTKSYIVISGKDFTNFSVASNTKNVMSAVSFLSPFDDLGCVSPCVHGSGRCGRKNGEYACIREEDILCPKRNFSNALQKLDYTNEAGYFDFPLSYQFRDSFLNNTALGRDYTKIYYQLGAFLADKVSIQLMLKTALTLKDCNIIMTKILNPTLYSADIAIDSINKAKLIELINDYKTISNEQEYQTRLLRIENDLNTYSGITVSSLISQFQ